MKDSSLAGLATPILATFGMELDALEVVPAGQRRLVRITVDGDGPAGRGLLLDDIASATRALSAALDESNAAGDRPYTLEVSSRGVSRPLTDPKHWRRNTGRLVAVTLNDGSHVTGRITSTTDAGVSLDVDGTLRAIVFADVRKAIVQVELNRPAEPDEVDVDAVEEIDDDDLDDDDLDDDDLDDDDLDDDDLDDDERNDAGVHDDAGEKRA